MNEDNLWSGSELELLVILLELEGFAWDNIVEHIAEDAEGGKGCTQCRDMLYSNDPHFERERVIALSRSELEVRPTGFPSNDPNQTHENLAAYYERNPPNYKNAPF